MLKDAEKTNMFLKFFNVFYLYLFYSIFQKPKLSVKPGEVYKEIPWEKTKQERQEYKLREKMVKGKYKRLYKSMIQGRQERAKEAWLLKKKRRLLDESVQKVKKGSKQKVN